jgi:signal transduction histidine kinase
VQESVTNVMKHAADHRATVVVRVGAEVIDIEVTDIPAASVARTAAPRPDDTHGGSGHGNGLVGMRERAAAVGGTLAVGPTPDGGWSVRARLPIGERAATTTGKQEENG